MPLPVRAGDEVFDCEFGEENLAEMLLKKLFRRGGVFCPIAEVVSFPVIGATFSEDERERIAGRRSGFLEVCGGGVGVPVGVGGAGWGEGTRFSSGIGFVGVAVTGTDFSPGSAVCEAMWYPAI